MNGLFDEMAAMSARQLEQRLRQGKTPDLDALVSHEFRGANIGRVPALLRIQKFIKGFVRTPTGVEGYNVLVQQNGLASPWRPQASGHAPERFGFFTVAPVQPDGRDNRYPRAVLLNYGVHPGNGRWRIERILRDYLVAPDPNRSDILLGKAYLALGPARLSAVYFILERLAPSDSLVAPSESDSNRS